MQPLFPPEAPFQEITMDFVTHLPMSTKGNDAIFTIVDRYSKMVRFVATKTTLDAAEAARILFEDWMTKFGMPRKIISDRDSKFLSKFWQSLMRLL